MISHERDSRMKHEIELHISNHVEWYKFPSVCFVDTKTKVNPIQKFTGLGMAKIV